jgi:hypothetical protein
LAASADVSPPTMMIRTTAPRDYHFQHSLCRIPSSSRQSENASGSLAELAQSSDSS